MMNTGGYDPPLGSLFGAIGGGFHHQQPFGKQPISNTHQLLNGSESCDSNSSHSTNSSIISTNHGSSSASPKNPKLYKTELCRSWMDHGRCNYGDRCQYAHGEHEKRPIPRHPKYKTEACQSFHQTGYCPYGPRCHFIHSEDSSPMVKSQQQQQSSPKPPQPPQSLVFSSGFSQTQRNNNYYITPQKTTSPVNGVLNFSFPIRGSGSTGESPIPSSTDSGTESPNGSFSPGLEFDDSSSIFSNASFFGTTPRPYNVNTTTNSSSRLAPPQPQKYQSTGLFDWTPVSNDFLNDFKSFNISTWSDATSTEQRLPVFQGFNTSH
ncbi:hypothetical protein L596_022463 [Steinernema carpocapsae]|uniref:C3H1-type domain-containing protein n=1 Tax=Steinernema carpocapsae TaxID=34508 RepID=A0A4U5MMN1_STECR|nr:hypothetical protein L596_022463 [Steinernema carpocapsae]